MSASALPDGAGSGLSEGAGAVGGGPLALGGALAALQSIALGAAQGGAGARGPGPWADGYVFDEPSDGMDLTAAKQKVDDLLADMRRNPLKYRSEQLARDLERRERFESAPSMTAPPDARPGEMLDAMRFSPLSAGLYLAGANERAVLVGAAVWEPLVAAGFASPGSASAGLGPVTVEGAGAGFQRAGQFQQNWQPASLQDAVDRIAGENPIPEQTGSGKMTFTNPNTGLRVVYDIAGDYFRVENPAGRGPGQYLDQFGAPVPTNVPLVKPGGSTQTGVPPGVRKALTHFSNSD